VNKQQLVKGFATSIALATTLALAAPGQFAVAQGQKPPTSTPVPKSKWVTQPVKFGKVKLYEHSSGWFDVKIPDNWTETDNSTDNEAIVSFADPTQNAAVFIDVYPNDTELSKAEMGKQLDTFVQKSYKKLTKFKANKPEALKDLNGAGEVFLYQSKLDNGKTVTMYGDAYLEQHDNTLMTLVVLLLPEEQYQTIKKQAYEIVNSVTAHPEAYTAPTSDPGTAPTSSTFEMGDLTAYEHPTSVFKLKVPENWKEVDSSTDGFPLVVWVEPSGLGVMSASATKLTKALKANELQTNIVSFINGYAKGNKKIKGVKIGDKNSRANEAAASFTFTNEINGEEVEMFGVATIKQDAKTVSYLLISLPKADLESVGDKPTEIFDSFEVDGSASF
jgi:hypothetical protein